MTGWVTGLASAVVPGLGQLLRRRLGDALFFLALATWLHVILGGLAWGVSNDAVWDGLLLGGLGFPSGTATPTVTVTTVLMFGVHLFAGWDAAENLPGAADPTDEAQQQPAAGAS